VQDGGTKTQIQKLIRAYKEKKELFANSTLRKEEVWKRVTDEYAVQHTAEQCRSKLKYLRQKYAQAKDTMGPRGTGRAAIKFTYFDQMDEILGSDPNIVPPIVASGT
jgi:hypothetical protein